MRLIGRQAVCQTVACKLACTFQRARLASPRQAINGTFTRPPQHQPQNDKGRGKGKDRDPAKQPEKNDKGGKGGPPAAQ